MANQYLRQFMYAKEPAVVKLFAKVTFGATGASTLVAASSKGIRSVTRNSAGDYTFVLTDSYVSLLNVQHCFIESAAPTAPFMWIKAATVTTTGAGTVEVVFNAAAAGAATDPGNGDAVLLEFTLKNSTAY